jgi:hypothetical protein
VKIPTNEDRFYVRGKDWDASSLKIKELWYSIVRVTRQMVPCDHDPSEGITTDTAMLTKNASDPAKKCISISLRYQ